MMPYERYEPIFRRFVLTRDSRIDCQQGADGSTPLEFEVGSRSEILRPSRNLPSGPHARVQVTAEWRALTITRMKAGWSQRAGIE